MYWIVYHIIWCSKHQRKILVGPIHDRLQQMIEQMVQEQGWQMYALVIQRGSCASVSAQESLPDAHGYCTTDQRVFLAHSESQFPWVQCMSSVWTKSTFYSPAGAPP
jgi:hypothetical protein